MLILYCSRLGLVNINDITECSSFKTFLYADDTVLTMSHRNTKHLETVVNIELEKVAQWLDGNQLTLNFSKTNYMLMGQQKGKFEITINSKTINQENNVCYLGVILDDKLNWHKHLDYLVKKLSIAAGMIYKLRPYLSQKLPITIYYSIVYSHLQYGIINWGSAAATYLNRLQVSQNKIVKIITRTVGKKIN